MIEIQKLKNAEIEHISEVLKLSKEAQEYIESFPWCKKVIKGWLSQDWGYMLCLFYFEITPAKNAHADKFVWVVVGDIPSAYIDIQSAPNAYKALESYIFIMEDWIEHVENKKSIVECYPINVQPTIEYAEMLSSRIKIIKDDFLSQVKG